MTLTSPLARRLLVPALGALLLLPLVGCNPSTTPGTQQASTNASITDPNTVAVVNGDKISRQDFDHQLEERRGQEILDRLVMERLIEQEAKKQGITIDPKELQARLDDLHKDHRYQMEVRQGVDPKLLDDQIRISLMLKKLMLKEITEEQKLRFFDRFKDDLTQVDVAQILVTDKAEADRIHTELEHGANFADEAKKYSKDPGSKDKGGEIGWFVRGQLEPPFSTVAFQTPKGQISPVVKSPYGYHIIKVLDKKDTYEQLKGAVEDQLLASEEKQYEDRLRAKADVKTIYDKDRNAAASESPAASSSPAPIAPIASPSASASPDH